VDLLKKQRHVLHFVNYDDTWPFRQYFLAEDLRANAQFGAQRCVQQVVKPSI
jgi:hypothetical protein